MIIYSSSAGSGKTFTLVKEYLKIMLGLKYKRGYHPSKIVPSVLAITFTKNATKEMKERIIEYLRVISLYKCEEKNIPDILKAIATPEHYCFVKERSSNALNYKLENYYEFSVMTIDSFIQKMTASFVM